jgi:hypothetical protein
MVHGGVRCWILLLAVTARLTEAWVGVAAGTLGSHVGPAGCWGPAAWLLPACAAACSLLLYAQSLVSTYPGSLLLPVALLPHHGRRGLRAVAAVHLVVAARGA